MRFKINFTQFIQNIIDEQDSDVSTIRVTAEDIFALVYGDKDRYGEFLQDLWDDTDIAYFFKQVSWVTSVPRTGHIMGNVDVDVELFKNAEPLTKTFSLLTIDVDDLKDWVMRNGQRLNECYSIESECLGWVPIQIPETGVNNQERPEKIVSEANNPESSKEITALTWESAIKYCLMNGIFKKAYHHFDIYWCGEANPMYSCADVLELARAVMDEINQSLSNGKIYVWAGEAQADTDFNIPHGVNGQRWLDLIASEAKNLRWEGKDASQGELMDGFGVRLVMWALEHRFFGASGVIGFHGYDDKGEIVATDEWRINSFTYWTFTKQKDDFIEACLEGNDNSECKKRFSWYDVVDSCYFIIESCGASSDEEVLEKIQANLSASGLRESSCILPVVAWQYNN